MFAKVLCFAALVAVATAYGKHMDVSSVKMLHHGGHDKYMHMSKHEESDGYGYGSHYKSHESDKDYYAYPKYEFEYKVSDPHTGDIKSQHEVRDGDSVKGYYGLMQPDGYERSVKYESEKKAGFRADVKYDIHHMKPLNHYKEYYHH